MLSYYDVHSRIFILITIVDNHVFETMPQNKTNKKNDEEMELDKYMMKFEISVKIDVAL